MSDEPVPVPAVPATRDSIRAGIFSAKSKQQSFAIIDFFGQKIELRQPQLRDVMEIQDMAKDENGQQSSREATIQMFLRYAYVPGTNDRVFEESDADAIMQLPFGPDMVNMTGALNKLTGINFPSGKADSEPVQPN